MKTVNINIKGELPTNPEGKSDYGILVAELRVICSRYNLTLKREEDLDE